MGKYDFSVLSSDEFEILCKDILEAESNIKIEHFKSGKDGGIDLRYISDEEGTVIVQCKRYADFSSLKGTLDKEVSKVERLAPHRYIIMTSAGLSPLNKKHIMEIFKGYILSSADIIGGDELQEKIKKYPEIERKHYKLWLASTSVMQHILYSEILNESDFNEEVIKEKIKTFVPNSSFNEALKLIEKNNVIILSGAPGVGKTTLAQMVCLNFLKKDYKLISIGENIESAFKLYTKDEKQIFYYDDFLGRNFLDNSLEKNEDRRIINFINKIRKSKNKVFIMTTREYILKQAQQQYDILEDEELNHHKYVIDVGQYTTEIKAKILYNHLFFSDISQEFIEEIILKKSYKKIINHKNYNPRIVEWMTKVNRTENSTPQKYNKEFIDNLDYPNQIWKFAYENHINEYSQYILLLLMIMQHDGVLLNDLKVNFDSLNRNLQNKFSFLDFNKGIKELEQSFIKTNCLYDKHYVDFQNPSVTDFIINYINSNENIELYRILWKSTRFFKAMNNIFTFKREEGKIALDLSYEIEYLENILNRFFEFNESETLYGQLEIFSYLDKNIEFNEKMKKILIDIYKNENILNNQEYVTLLIKYNNILTNEDEIDLFSICSQLIDDIEDVVKLDLIMDLYYSFPEPMEECLFNENIDIVLDNVIFSIRTTLEEDIDSIDYIEETFTRVGRECGFDIKPYLNEINKIYEEVMIDLQFDGYDDYISDRGDILEGRYDGESRDMGDGYDYLFSGLLDK
ncbi:nSTAND3 domain-containing NTPase [Viridibacillus arvi]|uniref:nSTAND3 domain-containing NTPase n=1 Tax=Viridibacillus arvi TaxID=263475 RepID=UPI0006A9DC5A|nr:restriction endonuclease [Viridibacillus arvi]